MVRVKETYIKKDSMIEQGSKIIIYLNNLGENFQKECS